MQKELEYEEFPSSCERVKKYEEIPLPLREGLGEGIHVTKTL